MRRAAIAGMILLSCVFICFFLSKRLKSYSDEFLTLSAEIYNSVDDIEKTSSVYNQLRSDWRKKEQFFIISSGRVSTAPIEESISSLGNAIASGDSKDIEKELAILISKFTELCERNSLKIENLG